jgi:hypothetical protein
MKTPKPNLLLKTNTPYGSQESPAQENNKALSPTVQSLQLLGANKPYGNT